MSTKQHDIAITPSASLSVDIETVNPKNDLLVLTYYLSFTDFKMKIEQYFRKQMFQ